MTKVKYSDCLTCGQAREHGNNGRYCLDCNRNQFADEFAALVRSGIGWGQIVATFHVTPASIERRLFRAGRKDLVMLWRQQFRDGGSYTMPGHIAVAKVHQPNWARKKVSV